MTTQQAKNKRKGAETESMVVNYLKPYWPGVERRRLTGAYDRGDIAGVGDPSTGRTVIEVKNEKTIGLSGYMKELEAEIANDDASYGVAIVRKRGTTDVGKWYAVLPVHDWIELRGGPLEVTLSEAESPTKAQRSAEQDFSEYINGLFSVKGQERSSVVLVKNDKKMDLPAYMKELESVASESFENGAIIVRKKGCDYPDGWYAVMPVADWVGLRLAAGD